MSWIKLISINLFVLVALLLLLEGGARLVWTLKTCMAGMCDYSRLNHLAVRELPEDVKINFFKTNQQLGYIPTPGFNQIINFRHWPHVKVSIDENGYRNNDNNGIDTHAILAVGDSFTFGDQVSNRDTWPSCLERSLNKGITNAGVSGYGAAQAIKRAAMILTTSHYDTVILSILLNDDFHRDKMDYFSGLPRPAVITRHGISEWASLTLDAKGSKWNPAQLPHSLRLLKYVWRYSIVGATLIDRISAMKGKSIDWTGRRLTHKHPDAAPIDDIIKFTLEQLSRLPVAEKYVLFQYSQGDLFNPEIEKIRHRVTNAAQRQHINVLDSFNYLKTATEVAPSPIWDGHHTAYGNQLVCQFIAENMKPK
ncbi:SGNH/GDSL hydrolase family protein [Vibrio rhizosphaerae]|uniref:SGNH/GDSL hydrolase family protein n=1 Tax=Vibrio rhizosphaerae TaxID=398736 RepID=UPI000A4DECF3|nr:hypothetical protein [Vibrio rhizosphaerae]